MAKTLEDMADDYYNRSFLREEPHYCDICGKRMSPRPLNKNGEEICFECEEYEEEESA